MVAVDRHGDQPARRQLRRQAGQAGDVAGIAAGVVAGSEHHQPAMLQHERLVGLGEGLVDRGVAGIPIDAAPGVVHHLHAGVDQGRIERLREEVGIGSSHRVALARTIVLRLHVTDDARRNQAGAWRDAAGKAIERLAGSDLRDPGAMADHVVDRGVVGRRIDVDQFLLDPSGQRRVVAHDAAVDHADGHAGTGVAQDVRGGGIGERKLGVRRRLIGRRA